MPVSNIAKKRNRLVSNALRDKKAISISIQTNSLAYNVFDQHIWREVYFKLVYAPESFKVLKIHIPAEQFEEFKNKIFYRLQQAAHFIEKVVPSLYKKLPIIKQLGERLTIVKDHYLSIIDNEGKNNFLSVEIEKEDGTIETHIIKR